MGARGPTPKPAARRQRRNKTTETRLRLVEPPAADAAERTEDEPEQKPSPSPPPRREWLAITKKRWGGFWGSRLAQLVDVDCDAPALERLFDLYDEHERAQRAFRKQRVVRGSMGQPVLHPMAKLMKELGPEIRMLEDRFGLTPAARMRMHVSDEDDPVDELERLNAALMRDDDGADPRAG